MAVERVLLPFALDREIRAARWPEALVADEALAAVVRASEGLPACFHWLVLEVRLTGEDSRVDLLASITDAPGGRAGAAAAVGSPAGLGPLASARPLLSAWSRPDTALGEIHVLGFEWDAPFTGAPLQLLSVDPRFWGPVGARAPTPEEQVALAAAGHAACFGEPPPPSSLQRLRRAIAALPVEGRAIAAATLRPRGVARDRLFVGLPRAQVLPWLDAIEWPGDRAQVEAWLPRIVAAWEPAFLQIELAESVTDYLGIEPRQTGRHPAEHRERRRFLERLGAEGRTSSEKIAAMTAWSREVDDPAGRREVRSLHMKCVLFPGREPLVKGYLGLHFESPGR
jgi:hypothetical protein